jgi:uncharacterized protein
MLKLAIQAGHGYRLVDITVRIEQNQVAISLAHCLSIVVGSPGLVSGVANTVDEAEQINRLCRIPQAGGLQSP